MRLVLSLCIVTLVAMTAKIGFASSVSETVDLIFENREAECVADVVWVEARGENDEGKLAVIEVILNRVYHTEFPSDPCAVIADQKEFQWYGSTKLDRKNNEWKRALFLAHRALSKNSRKFREKLVKDATFFCAPSIGGCNWHEKASRLCKVARVGNHNFYSICNKR